MSESSNPAAGRPGGSRSYGDGQTALRQSAAQSASTPAPAPASSAMPAPAPATTPITPAGPLGPAGPAGPTASGNHPLPPVPDTGDSRRTASGPLAGGVDTVGRALSGASRSFARVGAAIGNATQESSRTPNRPGSSSGGGAISPQARVRKARLRVARVDPWSVMKVSFVLSIAMGIVTIVGTAVVWNVLNALGVFTSLNKTVGDLTSSGTGAGTTSSFNLSSFLSFGHVEGYMMIIALVDVVLATALATLGAYLYNLAAGFVGGFEVTLAEDQ